MGMHSFYDSDTGKQVFGKGSYSGRRGAVYGNGPKPVHGYEQYNATRRKWDSIITKGYGSIIAGEYGKEEGTKFFISERIYGGGGFLIEYKPISGPYDSIEEVFEYINSQQSQEEQEEAIVDDDDEQINSVDEFMLFGSPIHLDDGLVVVGFHEDEREVYFYHSKEEVIEAASNDPNVLGWKTFDPAYTEPRTVESWIICWKNDMLDRYFW